MLHGGAYWRHLANTTEPSMCGGDADFLSNYFDHLLIFESCHFAGRICFDWLSLLGVFFLQLYGRADLHADLYAVGAGCCSYYNLTSDGCTDCLCDSDGSLTSSSSSLRCDNVTGDCQCRRNTRGRRCDTCRPGRRPVSLAFWL